MIIHVIYALAATLVVIFLFALSSVYKNIKLKAELKFVLQELEMMRDKNAKMSDAQINLIKEIEHNNSKIEYQQKLIQEFENLKQDIHLHTKATLFDLGNNLSKQLIEIHKKENQETRDFSAELLNNSSKKFNSEFERLVNMVSTLNRDIEQSKSAVDIIKNSLLSPSGSGSLAEITLENILNASSLRKELDFYLQYNIVGEQNKTSRPDAVVFLPSDNVMIVDAKASRFFVDNQNNEDALMKTMSYHLRNLSSKEYHKTLETSLNQRNKSVRNIVTVMFLPTEYAVEKILSIDKNFLSKAWDANIFPVGPTGLMNMLSIARFQISEEMMMHNHKHIIEEVRKILDSISILAKHSNKLGSSVTSLVSNYDKFVSSFNSNFLSKVSKIKSLGIYGKNTINDKEQEKLLTQIKNSDSQNPDLQNENYLETDLDVDFENELQKA